MSSQIISLPRQKVGIRGLVFNDPYNVRILYASLLSIFLKIIKLTDNNIFSGKLAGKWGSAIIRVCFVKDAVRNYSVNKLVGVQDIVPSLDSNHFGENVIEFDLMNIAENIDKPRMVAIGRIINHINFEIKNASIAVRIRICNLPTLNPSGLAESING